jgi:REP element-mobilizing transposase RayT
MPRAVAVGCAHHITQRGNARQAVFISAALCDAYLDVVKEHASRFGMRVLAYCLMTNHMHIVAIPLDEKSLAQTFRHANSRFAQTWNTLARRNGHLWQNRFYSCAVEEAGLRSVIRYVERNPVRAGMVERAEDYLWSSAAFHLEMREEPRGLLMDVWRVGGDAARERTGRRTRGDTASNLHRKTVGIARLCKGVGEATRTKARAAGRRPAEKANRAKSVRIVVSRVNQWKLLVRPHLSTSISWAGWSRTTMDMSRQIS